jgi:hypothetical protein
VLVILKITAIFILLSVQPLPLISRFKQRFEIALPICMMLDVCIILFTGLLFHNLTFGVWCVVLLAVCCFVSAIIIERKKLLIFLGEILTPGFCAWVVGFVFIWAISYTRVLTQWDDFMHWGKFIKQMMLNNRLYNANDIWVPIHQEYPPAMSLFQYLFCKIYGEYHEGTAIAANGIMLIGCLLPLTQWVNGKRKEIMAAIVLLTSFFALNITASGQISDYGVNIFYHLDGLYVDPHLGALFALYCIIVLFEKLSVLKLLYSCVIGTFLVLTKLSGISMALIGMVLYAIVSVMEIVKNKGYVSHNCNKHLLQGQKLLYVAIWSVPLICYKFWNYYLRDLFATLNAIDVTYDNAGSGAIEAITRMILGKAAPAQYEALRIGLNSWFSRPISDGYLKLGVVAFCALFAASLFILHYLEKRHNEAKDDTTLQLRLPIAAVVLLCGFGAYSLAMILQYGIRGNANLNSFSRYLSSYTTAMLLIIIAITVRYIFTYISANSYKKWGVALPVFISLLLLTPERSYGDALQTTLALGSLNAEKKYAEVSKRIDEYVQPQSKADAKTYLVHNDGNSGGFQQLSYWLLTNTYNAYNTYYDNQSHSRSDLESPLISQIINPKIFSDVIVSRGFSRVYIASLNQIDYSTDFRSRFYTLFDQPIEEISVGLYDVVATGDADHPIYLRRVPLEEYHYEN